MVFNPRDPFAVLPTELVIDVLLIVLHGLEDKARLSFSLRLLSVSKTWHRIALGVPLLWTRISYQDSWSSLPDVLTTIDRQIALSKSLKLDANVDWKYNLGLTPSMDRAQHLIKTLSACSTRLKTINLHIHSTYNTRDIHTALGDFPPDLPNLETLQLHLPTYRCPQPATTLSPIHAPLLKTLDLRACAFSQWNGASLPSLSTLTLRSVSITLEELGTILAQGTPKITELNLLDVDLHCGLADSAMEWLVPALRVLRLHTSWDGSASVPAWSVGSLMHLLDAPQLEEVSLDFLDQTQPLVLERWQWQAKFPKLTKVELQDQWVRWQSVGSVLRAVPRVKEVVIRMRDASHHCCWNTAGGAYDTLEEIGEFLKDGEGLDDLEWITIIGGVPSLKEIALAMRKYPALQIRLVLPRVQQKELNKQRARATDRWDELGLNCVWL